MDQRRALGYWPEAYKEGYTFDLWYTDADCTTLFYYTAAVNQDLTLYAQFIEGESEVTAYEFTEMYLSDQSTDFSFIVYSANKITTSNLSKYVVMSATTGDLPNFNVQANGDYYTITADGGYTEGVMYTAELATGVTLTAPAVSGFNLSVITELSFRIYKEEVYDLELYDSIVTIPMADLAVDGLSSYSETTTDTTTYYSAVVLQSDLDASDSFAVGTVIYLEDDDITDGDDSFYIKVTYVETRQIDSKDYYYFTAKDAELGDGSEVFEYTVDAEELASAQTISALLTDMVSTLSALPSIPSASNSTTQVNAFSDNAAIGSATLGFDFYISDLDVNVEVEIGKANNYNFDITSASDEQRASDWWGVNVVVTYSGELGNNVKLQATVDITEYINVTVGGYGTKSGNFITGYNVDFDYYSNIYTQTDLAFTILVCSANNEQEDPNAEEDVWGDAWVDITDEISGILSDDEVDSDSLVAQMLAMLEEEGEVIDLLDEEIFTAAANVYICDINFFARFELFNAEAEWTIYDTKWPLYSIGNQTVYLGLSDSNDAIVDNTVIVLTGDFTSNADAFPTIYGDYLNITTGEITQQVLPTSNFTVKNVSTPYVKVGALWNDDYTDYTWGVTYNYTSLYSTYYDNYVDTYGDFEVMNVGDMYLAGTLEICCKGSSATNFFEDKDLTVGEFESVWISDDYDGSIEALGEVYTCHPDTIRL